MSQPESTHEWKNIPSEKITISYIRARAGAAGFWATVYKLFDDRSKVTDDYCVYLLDTPFGYIMVDGHHRLRAAIWKRERWVWARVAKP